MESPQHQNKYKAWLKRRFFKDFGGHVKDLLQRGGSHNTGSMVS